MTEVTALGLIRQRLTALRKQLPERPPLYQYAHISRH